MDEEALGMERFSLKRPSCGRPVGRDSLLGSVKYILRKVLDKGISLHKGPFMSKGTWNRGGGVLL
jgi:hypothetical protein